MPAPLNLALVSALRELRLNSPSDTSTSYRRSAANPFRITSFADPCLLTPIESHLYTNDRGWGHPGLKSSLIFQPLLTCHHPSAPSSDVFAQRLPVWVASRADRGIYFSWRYRIFPSLLRHFLL